MIMVIIIIIIIIITQKITLLVPVHLDQPQSYCATCVSAYVLCAMRPDLLSL